MLEKIAFIYTESEEQDNLFTPYHTKFNCAIKYGTHCTPFEFPYQCNTDHVMPNVKDIMEYLMLDASTYDEYEDACDMAYHLGYDYYDVYEDDYDFCYKDACDKKNVDNIWNACKRTFEALHKMFTQAELDELAEEINE